MFGEIIIGAIAWTLLVVIICLFLKAASKINRRLDDCSEAAIKGGTNDEYSEGE